MESINYTLFVCRALDRGGRPLALSAGATGNKVYAANLDYSSHLQYWEVRRGVRPNGGIALINKQRNLCLARSGDIDGAPLILVGLDQIPLSDRAVWNRNDRPETYRGIHTWDMGGSHVINVPGSAYSHGQELCLWRWSRGQANELWAETTEVGKIAIKDLVFDMSNALIEDQTAEVVGVQTVVNDTSADQDQRVSFAFVRAHTYRWGNDQGVEAKVAIEFTGGLPFIAKNKVKAELKGTWKWHEENEETNEQLVEVEVPVRVPAHTSIRVTMTMLRARLSVPYRMKLVYTYPDNKQEAREVKGSFSGVNGYNFATKFEEIGTLPDNVRITAFDRLRGGAVAEKGNGQHLPALGEQPPAERP